MPVSLNDNRVAGILSASPSDIITSDGKNILYPTPSPQDWRDQMIYFLLVDRFNNPSSPPKGNDPCNTYQGGNFRGIREQLDYLKDLGAGAIWVSPVLANPPWFKDYWGGYGIQDFLHVEPRFCSDPAGASHDIEIADNEFRSLVDDIHARGMYVILDIVINHTGDIFNYEGMRDSAPWRQDGEYAVYWRDNNGIPKGDWTDIAKISDIPERAGIWPNEFQRNDFFRRRGSYDGSPDPTLGDFDRLKELVTEYRIPGSDIYPVRNYLIRAYQYLIARFDLDGFRIDTLQYVESDFARVFGNAMREYALSIGKKNFFTFGEIWQDDNENRIAEFIGRNTARDNDMVGVDAAIDFPMRKRLVNVCKGFTPPSELAYHFDHRREALKTVVSSHGEAGRYYITFLDNHDLNERFHQKAYPGQTKCALACLMTMQGIPCLYYGTEQGLDGRGDRREYVREALWGRPGAFSKDSELFVLIRKLCELRENFPALRYGRQYFRPCSGNGTDFGYSPYNGGVIAFSRILNDRELLVAVNTSADNKTVIYIAVDANLNPEGRKWEVLFSTAKKPEAPGATCTRGEYRTVMVTLGPMEAMVLG